MNTIDIGRLVSQRREYLNLNQQDVAELAEVTTRTIYKIEKGKGNPAIQTLQQIFDVLGLEINISIKKNLDERAGL